jgi:glycosyltransferase involved in cell wall biosynthesis
MVDKMRFLMLNWRDPGNPLSGGAERVTFGYLEALVKRGHEVVWFANSFPKGSESDEINGIRIIRGGGSGTSIIAARKWYQSQAPFDLVIDQHHGIPWFAPWWSRTNTVSYIHEVLGPIWNSFYRWPMSLVGQVQERWTHWLYRNIPFWTACESTRDDLQRNGVHNITIIRYGVNTFALPELPPKIVEAPLKLIVVSRLAPNKRIEHAIQTIGSLRDRGITARLKIIGSGEERERLESETIRLGLSREVLFMGALSESEKDRHLIEADLLLHTSQREGWGLNVIEANAMGTPAVVYPVAGLIESTLHEKTGLVADAEKPDSLADQIIRAARHPAAYQRWRINAWNRAKAFHWNQILPQACAWLEEQARK